jgi:hypothetical protein
LQSYLDERWDRQLEDDVEAGKLDHLIARAEADMARSSQALDEMVALSEEMGLYD